MRVQKLRSWYKRYERFFIPSALVLGFLSDVVMFRYVSVQFVLVSLVLHLALAGAAIAILNVYEARKMNGISSKAGWQDKFFAYAQIFSPLVLQYSFGSLFSAFVLFYSASGSLSASWPFVAALAFLMVGNEIFKTYYSKPFVQIGALFFSLFAFANWALPYILRDIGPWIFLLSGLLSVGVIALFVYGLRRSAPALHKEIRPIITSIAAIFAAMNILYFANIIPPIPLVLRDIGVYHGVQRAGDRYYVLTEEHSKGITKKFAITADNRAAYVFSSVFSPAGLDVNVVHEWQKWNSFTGKWTTTDTPSFSLAGGRDQGYRGYSWKTNMDRGLWRVNVKTMYGQVIGRVTFSVVESSALPPLRFETR